MAGTVYAAHEIQKNLNGGKPPSEQLPCTERVAPNTRKRSSDGCHVHMSTLATTRSCRGSTEPFTASQRQ